MGALLTASLISSLCSSVNRFNGLDSCAGPWDCAVAGNVAACWFCFEPSAPLYSAGAVAPRPRRVKADALKGAAFALTERSGSLEPA